MPLWYSLKITINMTAGYRMVKLSKYLDAESS